MTGAISRRTATLVVVSAAQFFVILDASVVNVALPAIQESLGIAPADLPWVINAYVVVVGGLLLLGGRLGDIFGRRKVFLLGVAVFTLASLLDGVAREPWQLIAARVLQGVGAALMSPTALAIILATFPSGHERERALAIWAAVAGSALPIGVILGGALVEVASWRWVFLINLPAGAIVLGTGRKVLPESRSAARPGFDLPGATLVTSGLMLLAYGITQAEPRGFDSAVTLGGLCGGLALLAAFAAIEARATTPLVSFELFRLRSLTAGNAVALLAFAALFATNLFISLYLQQVLGRTALATGTAFLPFAFGIVIGTQIGALAAPHVGLRAVVGGGLLVAAAGLAWMSGAGAGGTYTSEILGPLALCSPGFGAAIIGLTSIATVGVHPHEAGLASGVFNTTQQVGGALGIAVLSTVAAAAATGRSPTTSPVDAAVSGFHAGFLGAAGLLACAALMAVVTFPAIKLRLSGGAGL